MIFGGHVSIAGGLEKAISRGEAQSFEVIQTFASSPRSYTAAKYTSEQIEEFKRLLKDSKIIKKLFFHSIYLINLASEKPALVDLSVKSLTEYLNLGAKVNCTGTIFHVGSTKSRTFSQAKEQIIKAIKQVLQRTPKEQFLIMEFAAGAGNIVGNSLEELAALYQGVNSPRLKVCLDTQHLWASGVDVGSKEKFAQWLKRLDFQIGIGNLVCVHANDSKTELNSKRDRHENIGMGLIGKTGFYNILHQPLLQNQPFVLEVPGANNTGPDKENKDILKQLSLKTA